MIHARRGAALGEDFGAGLTRTEVDYLIDHEWATQVEDILWRRTKMDMRLDDTQRQHLKAYVDGRMSSLLAAGHGSVTTPSRAHGLIH